MVQAAIAADSRRYNVFTFLEDEGVDDVIPPSDHVTPQVGDATSDAKQQNDADVDERADADADADGGGEPEPLVSAGDTSTSGLVTSSPTKSSDDVADLEFKGNN